MINGVNPIKTEADVERASVSALSDEQNDDPMHTKPSEQELANYGNDADVMMTSARCEIKGFIANEVDRFYVECTQAGVQTQIEESLVDM